MNTQMLHHLVSVADFTYQNRYEANLLFFYIETFDHEIDFQFNMMYEHLLPPVRPKWHYANLFRVLTIRFMEIKYAINRTH